MTTPTYEYRLDVAMTAAGGTPHVALWLDADGHASRALFVSRLATEARRVYDTLAAGRRPPELAVAVESWPRLAVSPVRVYVRWESGWNFHADLDGTSALYFDDADPFEPRQPSLD